ncbi:TonB-dependent siderophore receptor [Pseudomonas dryadis]|uniref:TonB-dependent siderophore receptor n=2 Tax=Pseudomonadales TaxID=72274 RepID=A0ABY1Z1J8_9GAMM|nr:TonB-dependent siderophore receptor [Pseudomonas dryadis]TBV12556.1 TonB-dependent siderophore receptor [Pseudomonas sp. FRB 230]
MPARHLSKLRPLTKALLMRNSIRPRLSLAGISMALALTVAPQVQAQEWPLNIPAQPLAQALQKLAEQVSLQILYNPSDVQNLRSNALNGRYGLEESIGILLQGTGASYQLNGNTVTVQASGSSSRELSPVTITGKVLETTTEGSGSYTTGAVSVGGKTPIALRETPQSVSVLTRQNIEDQGITNIEQALDKLTGVTVVGGNNVDTKFYARGFEVTSVQTDGGAPGIRQQNYQSLSDMAMYDHIEILRGSDGLFSGTGEPGGTLNLVRKKPLPYNQIKTTTSAGSWDNYRQEVDITGPLAFDGRLRARGVFAVEDRDYFYDTTSSKKEIYYGILEADLSPDTLFTLGGSHQWRKIKGYWDSGLPRYDTGEDIGLSRDTSLAADWSTSNYETNEIFVKIEHTLNENWKVNGSYTRYSQDITQNIGQATGTINNTTGEGSLFSRWGRDYTIDQDIYDANVSGRFQAFGLEHEVLFGVDHQETRRSFESYRLGMANIPVDPRQNNIDDQPMGAMPDIYITFPAWNQRKSGAYSTLRAQLAEPLKLIIGTRYSDYNDNIFSTLPAYNLDYPTGGKDSGVITPFGGLVYTVNDQWSVYTSYSQIYTPQTTYLDSNYQSLKPITGDTYELGTKAELLNKKANLSLAVYYTKRENEAMQLYSETVADTANPCCYEAAGKIVSKGIDAEITGELLPNWQIGAGYTFNINEQVKTGTAANRGKPLSTQTPKHLLKLFTSYRLPGNLDHWKVGLGANIQSHNYVSGTSSIKDSFGNTIDTSVPYNYEQPGYAIWNALVDYKIDNHWTASLNVNNIFDKKYYQTVGTNAISNWYGNPREYMLTLRGTF